MRDAAGAGGVDSKRVSGEGVSGGGAETRGEAKGGGTGETKECVVKECAPAGPAHARHKVSNRYMCI
jgi:hypothetical protein